MDRLIQLKGINWRFATAIIVLGTLAVYCLPDAAKGYTIGSFTAIFIAFVAYPWQKELDRKLQIEVEMRRMYVEAIRLIFSTKTRLEAIRIDRRQNHDELLATFEKWFGALHDLEQAINTIGAIGPEEVAISGGECVEAFRNINLHMRDELRRSLFEAKNQYTREEVFKALRAAQKENMATLDEAINVFLNSVRKHAFQMNGKVSLGSRILETEE